MNIENYLDERIMLFNERLHLIAECRMKEMKKAYDKRNYNLLYMFHKDEATYNFCLEEFESLKKKYHEE
jgi:hypothetical protein